MALKRSFLIMMAAGFLANAGHRYEIDIVADTGRDKLAGTLRLTYRNETARTLEELPLRGTAVIQRVLDGDGQDLSWTSSSVRFRSPLQPGGEAVLLFEFETRFSIGRDGYRHASGAWHPKAQTFRGGTFNPRQQQPDDYDVRIVFPAGEMVALPGKRVEESTLPDGRKQLRVLLENATSAGLAMSPAFQETVRRAGEVEIRAYRLGHQPEWGPKLADLAGDIVPFYREFAGFYPHSWLTILPGSMRSRGGYPAATGMVVIHDLAGTDADFPSWILAHEIGHQYWGYDTVIDDGDYYHWPGLAMGIWMDRQYMERRGLGRNRHDLFLTKDYLSAVYSGHDTTIRRTWDEIRKVSFDFNNAVAHGKAYTAIQMLEEVMGPTTFRQFAIKLLKDYRFRFLSHAEFEKAAAAAHGAPLDWFFRDWLDGNGKLGYEIAGVKYEGRLATVRIRQTGEAVLALPVLVKTADGVGHRLRLKRAAGEQSLSFETDAAPVFGVIDPERRFPLYSPDAGHLWGKKVEVAEIRWPEKVCWGTNRARLVLRNTDDRPHELNIQIQANTQIGGYGWNSQHRLGPGEEKEIEREFIVKPTPGPYTLRLEARDQESALIVKLARAGGDFQKGNTDLASLRIPEKLCGDMGLKRCEYPSLRLLSGARVDLYYLAGDAWLESHAPELLAERERYFEDIRKKINPAFDRKVTVLLFPDGVSKRAWTAHQGRGWAVGDLLVEVRNAEEKVDPAHELVHVLAQSLGQPPAVLAEGLAVYFQEGQRWNGHHVDSWCKAFESAGLLWPLERIASLREIGSGGTQPSITYPQAGSFVKFLIERTGYKNFLAGYRAFGRSETVRSREEGLAVFQKYFGMDPDTAEREWRAALAASSVQPVPEEVLDQVKQRLK